MSRLQEVLWVLVATACVAGPLLLGRMIGVW